ncbi:MAG: R3H domain-containing nucleic acid-binding protein [Candidatus Gastranaerophilaceae bacterium]
MRSNSTSQVQKVLKEALGLKDDNTIVFHDETEEALDEAKEAIQKVLQHGEDVELSPQSQQIRKMQHELVEQHNLSSVSVGDGNERHLKIVGGKEFKQDIV